MSTPRTHTVLYIEDDPASKKLLQQFLKAYDAVEFITAWSAEEGIALSRKHKLDLVFLDIMLPCMNGREALAKLRQEPGMAGTPVYAISADAIPEHISQNMAAGFNGYITKPVNLQEIGRLVEALLAKP